ncbi:fam-a protein [Plasmodium vinckei vinckei]|uniref:Fam-a protein n=1 Tax=Plasmodium vinckei vinckei TaxID=54757 RepID=A0A449BZ89_PLAVN|nr:fam-a protein [Plasmodium vinckei vinckei]VEV58754.1 fam-a protein [Plasmodium vinckei vinckei]
MNKIYIKVALALLGIAGYMQNVAFASETDEENCEEDSPIIIDPTPIFEQYEDEISEDKVEALAALKYVGQSLDLLEKLSRVDVHDYSTDSTESEHIIYNKKIGKTDIGRLDFTIPSASKYVDVVRHYWDFKYEKNPDKKIINAKVARLYCKNLVVFEKHNPDPNYTPPKKIYRLCSRRPYKTICSILAPSRALKYDGEINKKTELTKVYKKQKPIEFDINPEEALSKLRDNLAGFVIKKGGHGDNKVHVTYINAIYDNGNSTEFADNKRQRDHEYTKILKLAQRIIDDKYDYRPRAGFQSPNICCLPTF